MKKVVVLSIKIGLSVAILAWLFARAMQGEAFDELREQLAERGLNWPLLLAAFSGMFLALVITIVRWYYLVRALGIPFTLRESFRLGFLGYLFNMAPMGIVGGDLLKAVMLARQQSSRRALAVATVAVDRIIGLYVLFVVASAAIGLSGFYQHGNPQIRFVSLGTLAMTGIATAGLAALFIPGVTQGRMTRGFAALPYVGHHAEHLIEAVRLYRNSPGVLGLSVAMTVAVHALFTLGVYWITLSIYPNAFDQMRLGEEFVIVPLASATAVIPVVVGPFELVLDSLYNAVFGLHKGCGLVVSLGYRLVCLLIALVGVCYYLSARSELSAAMHEAEEISDDDPATSRCSRPAPLDAAATP